MLQFTLSFLLGDLLLQSCAHLPTLTLLSLCAFLAMVLLITEWRRRFCTLILIGFFAGYAWSGWHATQALHWQLPPSWEEQPLVVRGVVDSLPVIDQYGVHFIFVVSDVRNQNLHLYRQAKVHLSWATKKPLYVGDAYEFTVHLKRVRGLRNPGGFDYEAWALGSRLRASGSVDRHADYQFLGHKRMHAPVNQVRQWLREHIATRLPQSATSPWLYALMIGERSEAPAQHWEVLRATGTNHLMAIAGLHIGLISGLVFWCVTRLWRRSVRLTMLYPVPLAASVASLFSAWLYSALSGFSIPTQRACIMVTFILCATLLRRKCPAWHAWSAALLTVLLLNPLAVLSDSFWLSFGTIALIIYGMRGRLHPGGWWWQWGRVQWVIGFGLLPLSLFFFQQVSVVSVAANSIAIPWLGFLILPFCVLALFFLITCPPLAGMCLYLADKSLAGLWWILEWFAHLSFSVWTLALPSTIYLFTTMLACIFLLLPAGMPGRWLGILWLLPILTLQPNAPAQREFWVTVLDVGQGLSVVVQTRQHALVFDAGPRFSAQFDMGESVVVPYLRMMGVRRLDKLIISHGDNDHIGGAYAVMHALPVTSVLTSAVAKFKRGEAELCLAGMHWQWDGINFTMMYPFPESISLGNDSSCVLKIDNGKHSFLLTGDIEHFAETQLLQKSGDDLHADILTAPHHGSKTSSQSAFIHKVNAQYVVYATGYRNRYHFPHAVVMNEYASAGVIALNSVDAGAVQYQLTQNADYRPLQFRPSHQHYWHD